MILLFNPIKNVNIVYLYIILSINLYFLKYQAKSHRLNHYFFLKF